MRILLSYSFHHFDPYNVSKRTEKNASAGILARSLYEILSELGDVTYTDAYRYKEHAGEEFDLFVGISSHFSDILNVCKVKQSIFLAVNMHPLARNMLLSKAISEWGLGDKSISKQDMVDPTPYLDAIKRTNFILCAGNISTYNSYLEHGVPKSKIKTFNYGLLKETKLHKNTGKTRNYAYVASEIGLRKGFDIVYETFSRKSLSREDFHLSIVGRPSTIYHQKKITKLKKLLGKKLTYHGWLDAGSSVYQEVLKRTDFLILPSVEEGQAGTAVDAIAYGVIPIVSSNTGLDYSPLGNLTLFSPKRSEDNLRLIQKSLRLDREMVRQLQQKTLEYYREYHQNFRPNLKESIENALEGCIYPKVSVILTIFNKEKTIKGLIKTLDIAISDYPSIELLVIFDGCSDKTESIVRSYFQRHKRYTIKFFVTSNIFETKANNLGLKKSTGQYCVIVQDDNYIYERDFLYEAVNYLDKNRTAVVLGGLAGVNFYPLGTGNLKGSGQITMNENEVYWRQDERSDPKLKNRIFQVDACMRGPLILRKSFLESHGYLDEIYAPLYEDDMDLCMRAASLGYKVYCVLIQAENKSLTMAHYDPERSKFFARIIKRNTGIFYSRWNISTIKDYSWVNRTQIWQKDLSKLDKLVEKFKYALT